MKLFRIQDRNGEGTRHIIHESEQEAADTFAKHPVYIHDTRSGRSFSAISKPGGVLEVHTIECLGGVHVGMIF